MPLPPRELHAPGKNGRMTEKRIPLVTPSSYGAGGGLDSNLLTDDESGVPSPAESEMAADATYGETTDGPGADSANDEIGDE